MKLKHIDKRNKRNRKNKEKNKIWKKILLIIIIILAVFIGVFAYKTYKNGGGISGMLATAVGHDENTKKNLKEIKVLIMGISTDIDAELTDTIMVASYNPKTQKANLLSIPRDTFTGKYTSKATASQKINALYNMRKNPEDTLNAVNKLTGLDIKYYALVRTEALIKLVDAIGGVQFDVPINMKYDDPSQKLHINLKAGTQLIDGEKAEQLLRFRHNNNGTSYSVEYGDNDLGRMRTQREFIAATLKQTLKPSNIFKLGQILEIAQENIESNLEFSYIKNYIPYAVEFNTENLQTAALPGTTPDLKNTNNVSIFVVDEKETKKLVEEMFSDEEVNSSNSTSSKAKIELLNGTGDKSKLESIKNLLEENGFEVTKTGETSSVSKTVISNKKNISNEILNEIKTTIGAGQISANNSSTSKVDVCIIIGKDI